MAGIGSVTSTELAARTSTAERDVREWLCAQAARGYVSYDGDGRFPLPAEHAVPLTDETSPAIDPQNRCGSDRVSELLELGMPDRWRQPITAGQQGVARATSIAADTSRPLVFRSFC